MIFQIKTKDYLLTSFQGKHSQIIISLLLILILLDRKVHLLLRTSFTILQNIIVSLRLIYQKELKQLLQKDTMPKLTILILNLKEILELILSLREALKVDQQTNQLEYKELSPKWKYQNHNWKKAYNGVKKLKVSKLNNTQTILILKNNFN